MSIWKFVAVQIADFFTNPMTVRLPSGHSCQKSCRRNILIGRGPFPRDWEHHPDRGAVNSCRRGHALGGMSMWMERGGGGEKPCETHKWMQFRFRLLEYHHLHEPMRSQSLTYHLDVTNCCYASHKEVNLNFSCAIWQHTVKKRQNKHKNISNNGRQRNSWNHMLQAVQRLQHKRPILSAELRLILGGGGVDIQFCYRNIPQSCISPESVALDSSVATMEPIALHGVMCRPV
jgi:hypothetical protein